MDEIMERLSAQERLLQAILSALAPSGEPEGPGLEDLIEALQSLTTAVEMQGEEIRCLRSVVSRA
ncbi:MULTISPECIES: hypothetical protein [Methylobacteriaceae]|uniref:hypothetical protein n=1 Tax=Methylobacteriaceae TaxID=119045 RepID=UPI000CDAE690|nr:MULTISPECIES: hypothetical protein [Methylobacteriaceae]MCP1549451.1 hypothetical protein [Methylorubrum zatmanii]MCP1579753.1 hypothetical protein [Methylorubrum extorquens]POR40994.1 hypothetical protein CRT23_21115 [Methylobacterium sp. V23]